MRCSFGPRLFGFTFPLSALACSVFLTALTGETGMSSVQAAEPAPIRVYFGTYTGAESKGIYTAIFDRSNGSFRNLELAAESKNPSFLAIHPSLKSLYAVSEVSDSDGKPTGAITAFSIDPQTGKLTKLNSQSSGGTGPCHVTIDKTGKTALAANYGGGSVIALPIETDGKLGQPGSVMQHQGSSVNPQRQKEPHAHSIYPDPSNRFAVSADLGLDQVLIYALDVGKSQLKPNQTPFAKVDGGSGPRHFAFHPNAKFGYVINELANTVVVFQWDSEAGKLTPVQKITTLPADWKEPSYTAEVQVHPSGKFLYGSNRGHNSLAIFQIDPQTGLLTAVGHQLTGGKAPRNFGIDPSGHFVLAENQDSDSVHVFKVDQQTGKLSETGNVLKVGKPVCVKFVGP